MPSPYKDVPVFLGDLFRIVTLRDVSRGAPSDLNTGFAASCQPRNIAGQRVLFVRAHIQPQTSIGGDSREGPAVGEDYGLADAHHAHSDPGSLRRRGIA